MSIELVLVPLAIAAYGAWQTSRTEQDVEGRKVCHVATRMRDEGLLAQALRDTQATTRSEGDTLIAAWQGVQGVFERNAAGILQARFTGDCDEARALGIVTAVDQAYARRVQEAVLTRIRQQAPQAGMSVASESREADDSVVLVLNVGATA